MRMLSRLPASTVCSAKGLACVLVVAAAISLPWLVQIARGAQPQPADRTGQPWTQEEAKAHAERFNDSSLWNLKYLKNDVATMNAEKGEWASLAFPQPAFNTPDYERTGRVMPGLNIGPMVGGVGVGEAVGTLAGVHRMLDLKDVPAGKQWHEVVVTEPLLAIVASGAGPLKAESSQAISRSHPHYLFQGSFSSASGQIRWVAVRMADGTELAIVNGRVLDLKQGNLVLVRQHADGSIRIHQHTTRLEAARGEELRASIPEVLKQPELQEVLNPGK